MKKLLALALVFLLAPAALGQSVGASQIKKHTNGGLVADSANALAVGIYQGTSAPSGPVAGQLWLDTTTTPATLKAYSGSAWAIPPTGAAITQDTLATFPATPTDGMVIWVRSLKRALIYDSVAATWYYMDSAARPAQADYSLTTFSTDFLSSPGNTTGAASGSGTMTAGLHACAITHYNSTGGETMPGGYYSVTLTASQKMDLSFAATGTGVAGKRVWCSKAGTTTPLYLITTIHDTTTGTYTVNVADTSFGLPTSPDVDFSAPIPSGWTHIIPDRTYGGCGSTGSALLCIAYKQDSQTSTTYGPRLYYGITGTSGRWRVTGRVTRWDKGFANTSTTGTGGPVGLIATPDGTAAGATTTTYLKPTVVPFTTCAFGRDYRNTGAAWSGTATALVSLYDCPIAVPTYFALDVYTVGATYYQRWAVSGNGSDWSVAVTDANSTEPRFVGLTLERISSTGSGGLIAIDQFTFTSE